MLVSFLLTLLCSLPSSNSWHQNSLFLSRCTVDPLCLDPLNPWNRLKLQLDSTTSSYGCRDVLKM